ncbi:MAG: SDR family NAD(P)-dependent oxidoreductase [Gemmatimonadota bacterium]|nr:SDR family NAD(P)-dependent oxidoreductase [Gemmatimonadota bacterium]MDH3424210.1 SDR family NAD(P)-dependent oxidoreductase [Gemmatimonadota bacterium]
MIRIARVSMALLATSLAAPLASSGQELEPVAGRSPTDGQRVVLVTGSTGGLGREVARTLAARGDHVVVHGRSADRGMELVAEIEAGGRGSARLYLADFGSFDAVRALARAIRRDYDRLDVLVNNAGIWLQGPRQLSDDGYELHFQVNYLSSFLLTRELLPLLRRSAPSRIVHVSSAAQRPIDFDDVMLDDDYTDGRAYAQSKLAQIMFTFDLAEELAGSGVSTNAVHPASMMDTDMVLERGARVRSSVHDGVDAVMHLIDGDDLGTGGYFNQTTPTRANQQAYDERARERLRALAERLTAGR